MHRTQAQVCGGTVAEDTLSALTNTWHHSS